MNFLNTGALSLNTGGLDFTSASGQFLTSTSSEVPEPFTGVLLGLGLASLLAGCLRRKRQRGDIR